MSDTEEDDPNLPPAIECDRRCKEFAEITCTDSALAMFYLQDRNWELERSLADYFRDTESSGSASAQLALPENSHPESSVNVPDVFVDSEPHRIRILSWNIDGLDQSNIITRTKGVCQTILREKPDVVFLQEVVNKSLEVLTRKCDNYEIVIGNRRGRPRNEGDYFTAMMLRKETSAVSKSNVEPFTSSVMMRTLLTVQATVKGIDCHLMTAHLESTRSHAPERIKQLRTALSQMKKVGKGQTAIFGGDLNLRDKEFQGMESQGFMEGIADVWEYTGKRPEAMFTWNMQFNDNLSWDKPFRPKCRFDRLYYRPGDGLKAVYFELVGLERLPSCQRFPSDHWGILAHFDKK